jgi:hypothetical protein
MLPHFSNIWRSEQASFLGDEPDISDDGRMREAQKMFATLSGRPPGDLAQLARGVDVGPELVHVLATQYRLRSPW